MGRNEFRAAYREARKFNRFQQRFWDRLRTVRGELSMYWNLCPGFTPSRLHGDALDFPASVRCGSRMAMERSVRPRLPA